MSHSVSQQMTIRPATIQCGFSLFELIVYILVASILFAAAFNRYQSFPGEAERANFTAVLAQLKTGINLEMISVLTSGASRVALDRLQGSNPMDLMLETPANYIGALESIDESRLPRRVWYFDEGSGELVYLVERAENLFLLTTDGPVPANKIRLKVSNIYSDPFPESEPGTNAAGGRWQGVILSPVEPYEWQSVPLRLYEAAQSETSAVDPAAIEIVEGFM